MIPRANPNPLRQKPDVRCENQHGTQFFGRISAGEPNPGYDQTEPPSLEAECGCSPDGAWFVRSPDERWLGYGVQPRDRVVIDVNATAMPGRLVAVVHPGSHIPDLVYYTEETEREMTVLGPAQSIVRVLRLETFAA